MYEQMHSTLFRETKHGFPTKTLIESKIMVHGVTHHIFLFSGQSAQTLTRAHAAHRLVNSLQIPLLLKQFQKLGDML
jgi:hypothetical protein